MDSQEATSVQHTACPPPAKDDVAEEVEVWWGAPSTRSMAPSFLVSSILTAIIAGGAWYLCRLRPEQIHWWRYGAYFLAFLLWGQQMVQWSYRSVFVNYRLTTCRLWRDSGIRRPSGMVLELTQLKEVCVEAPTTRERWLGIGRVRVTANGTEPGIIILYGLREPQRVAELIRTTARRAVRA